MNLASVKKDERYTYAEYATWGEDLRCELIDGSIRMMTAPSDPHQSVLLALGSIFKTKLKGSICKPYVSPFAVRLNFDTTDDMVVLPDLLIVCDRSKLDGKSVKGAPDLVVEILSPSTKHHDKVIKYNKYQEFGVLEYWIIDPDNKFVEVLVFADGGVPYKVYTATETIVSFAVAGLEVDLVVVFEEY